MKTAVTAIAMDRYLVTMLPKFMDIGNGDTFILDTYTVNNVGVRRDSSQNDLLTCISSVFGEPVAHDIVHAIESMKTHLSEALERQDSWSL